MLIAMEILIFISKAIVLIRPHEFWTLSIKVGHVAIVWLVLTVNLSPYGSHIHLDFLSNFGGTLSF